MPANSSTIWSSVRSRRSPTRQVATHPELPLPVLLCAIRSARRMRLRFDERERILKLTHPRGVRASGVLAWAASQKHWVEEQLGRALPPQPLVSRAVIPVEGIEVELVWDEASPRAPSLAGGKLIAGGPQVGFPKRVQQFLRQRALEILSKETAELGGRAHLPASEGVGFVIRF